MKLHILFGVMFCLALVSGRNLHEDREYSEDDTEKTVRDPTANQLRHRRRSRQSFYDYNYHDYRRDYNRQQDEIYNQILGYLEEIAHNLRRAPPPPPPPQPIYIPYPVPYYVPQYINCNNQAFANNTGVPELNKRWPDYIEDDNQIFGVVPGLVDTGNSDGSRPINLDPIPPGVNTNDAPNVDHGTVQATEEPKTEIKKPGLCKAAVLTCCNLKEADQRACFVRYNCPRTYETGLACRPEVIKKVLEEFSKAYAPVNQL